MADPPLRIYDEGSLLGPVFKLNFVGAGVTATRSGITGTITVSSSNIFDVNGFVMTDSDGVQWRITIDTLGSLVSTVVPYDILLETGDYILLETGYKIILG